MALHLWTGDCDALDAHVAEYARLLVVETCVAYETAAQVRHSAFCYFYGAQAGEPLPRLCEIGNYAD